MSQFHATETAQGKMPRLKLESVSRVYERAGQTLPILKNVDLSVTAGEMVALVAPSGVGKSTLLHLAGLLEKPNSGKVFINGQDTVTMSERNRTALRRNQVGFVYQFHHLLPEFSALENLILPQLIAGLANEQAMERACQLLQFMGIEDRKHHRPAQMSGGEQQRVAIARAVANQPGLLMADEPTGNLDPATSDTVFGMLIDLARHSGLGALIATHNHELATQMDRCVTIAEGKIVPLILTN